MSEVKVNKISPRTNCGTVQLGDSGDTITIPAGATITNNGTQTGFGRTGTVDWQTTPKTTTFTAENGEGYFINQGSAITANLPAGSAGAIVAFSDYARNFGTYNFTISPNGSEKIGGIATDAVLANDGQAATFIYVDSTKGWINVQNVDDSVVGAQFVAATGGNTTATVDTNFKVHTFTGPGTFCVSSAGNSAGSNKVDYLIVAGGGGGATQHSGGGGAGGFRGSFPSPNGNAGTTPVSVQGYPVTVGGGGAKTPTGPNVNTTATPGVNSTWNSITSAGGGGGGGYNGSGPFVAGASGGSGGGGASGAPGGTTSEQGSGGAGNTPPQSSPASPVQGHAGGFGTGHNYGGGGGGGAAAVGANAGTSPTNTAGAGGAGKQNNIDGNNYYWSGGGGGGSHDYLGGAGGIGGGGGGGSCSGTAGTGGGSAINAGGNGSNTSPSSNKTGGNGGDNSGGGGAGSGNNGSDAGNGGSGIVILRYKFQ
jgi:hypothetical protein